MKHWTRAKKLVVFSSTFLRHLTRFGIKGLIFKIIKMDIPSYILKFIIDFLKDRKYRVSIGDTLSESGDILCSVPQGSVLGPLLFLVFIYDIPLAD